MEVVWFRREVLGESPLLVEELCKSINEVEEPVSFDATPLQDQFCEWTALVFVVLGLGADGIA